MTKMHTYKYQHPTDCIKCSIWQLNHLFSLIKIRITVLDNFKGPFFFIGYNKCNNVKLFEKRKTSKSQNIFEHNMRVKQEKSFNGITAPHNSTHARYKAGNKQQG